MWSNQWDYQSLRRIQGTRLCSPRTRYTVNNLGLIFTNRNFCASHNLGFILPKSNSAKNNFFENITIKLFWRVDFPLPHGAKPLEARGEATSTYL